MLFCGECCYGQAEAEELERKQSNVKGELFFYAHICVSFTQNEESASHRMRRDNNFELCFICFPLCLSARPSANSKWLVMIPLTHYYRDQGELVSVISSRSLLPWSVGEISG